MAVWADPRRSHNTQGGHTIFPQSARQRTLMTKQFPITLKHGIQAETISYTSAVKGNPLGEAGPADSGSVYKREPRASAKAPFPTERTWSLCLKQNKRTRLRQNYQWCALRGFSTCSSRYDSFWVEISQEQAVYES